MASLDVVSRLVTLILLAVSGCTSASGTGGSDGGDDGFCVSIRALSPCEPDAAVGCTYCYEGAGNYCVCYNGYNGVGVDGGPFWECGGTGQACK